MTNRDLATRIEAARLSLHGMLRLDGSHYGDNRTARSADTPVSRLLAAADDEALRALAMWAHRHYVEHDFRTSGDVLNLMKALGRRRLNWTGEEALALLD